MKVINQDVLFTKIYDAIKQINISTNTDFYELIKDSKKTEKSDVAKHILNRITDANELSKKEHSPFCQDTGSVVVFVEIGNQLKIDFDLTQTINDAVAKSYKDNYFRMSIVKHPLDRENTKTNTPCIIHYDYVTGDKLKISIGTKGAGSENQSFYQMLRPTNTIEEVETFIVNKIKEVGGKACPPLFVGIGIGGNFETATLLAKKSLFRKVNDKNPDPIMSNMEKSLFKKINDLNIGPMGFGGKNTCLVVKVNHFPCHIASLPVAINLNCHAVRSTTVEL